MHIESSCPGCGSTLRVDADHAGKPARCPTCNTVYTVPIQPAAVETAAAVEDLWHLKTPEGQSYGPVTRNTLDQWVADGRISDDCQLLSQSHGVWQGACEVYSILKPIPKGVRIQQHFDIPVPSTASGDDPNNTSLAHVRFVNPHRGGLILALGILSWAIGCPVFGIMAWVMGSNDLRDMQRGAMDVRGAGLTQAGYLIGMIHAIVFLFTIVVLLIGMLILGMLN